LYASCFKLLPVGPSYSNIFRCYDIVSHLSHFSIGRPTSIPGVPRYQRNVLIAERSCKHDLSTTWTIVSSAVSLHTSSRNDLRAHFLNGDFMLLRSWRLLGSYQILCHHPSTKPTAGYIRRQIVYFCLKKSYAVLPRNLPALFFRSVLTRSQLIHARHVSPLPVFASIIRGRIKQLANEMKEHYRVTQRQRMSSSKSGITIAIIGGGLGGITAAIVLGGAGYSGIIP
jgi:hypothetical protein